MEVDGGERFLEGKEVHKLGEDMKGGLIYTGII